MCFTFRSTTSRWSSSAGVSSSYISLLPSPFLPHHVKLGLTTQNPAHLPVHTQLGVLFLSRADRLLVPFGNRRRGDRKSTRLNSSHLEISYAVFCLKKRRSRQR